MFGAAGGRGYVANVDAGQVTGGVVVGPPPPRLDGGPDPASTVRRMRRKSDYHTFFFDVVPVPPTRFRPASKLGDSVFENPANVHLTAILKANARVIESRESAEGTAAAAAAPGVNLDRFVAAYMELQGAVNCLFDSTQNKDASKTLPAGVKQRLEKKEGLFRKHMMVRSTRRVRALIVCVRERERERERERAHRAAAGARGGQAGMRGRPAGIVGQARQLRRTVGHLAGSVH